MTDVVDRSSYIEALDVTGLPRSLTHMGADSEAEAENVFQTAKAQTQIVGSGVFSFAVGVTAEVRSAIADSALLAQLVANKRVVFEENPKGWFSQYVGVLENVGWVNQEGGIDDYDVSGTDVEVNEKIVDIMKGFLGPAAAAIDIIQSTVNALQAMKPDSSWITLFSRESQRARIARFQIGLVEQGDNGQVFVALLLCLIEAKHNQIQVLVFKFRDARARFHARKAKVSINQDVLKLALPAIRQKIQVYTNDYVSSIKDL